MKNLGGRSRSTNSPEHIERVRVLIEDRKMSFRQAATELGLKYGSVWWTYYGCVPPKSTPRPIMCARADRELRPTVPFVPGLTNSASYKLDNPANVWQYEWRL